MRTIIVIFTDKKVSFNEAASYKRYKFLCNYGVVSIYDMVEDPKIYHQNDGSRVYF